MALDFTLPLGFDASASPENTALAPTAVPLQSSEQLNARLAAGVSPFAPPDNAIAFAPDGLPSSAGVVAPDPAAIRAGAAPTAEAPAPSLVPPTPPGPGKPPPAFVAVTDREKSTTGLDAESAAKVKEGISRQGAAQEKADTSAAAFEQYKADRLREQGDAAIAAAAASKVKADAELFVQQNVDREVNEKLNSDKIGGVNWRPNTAEIFEGGKGALFGISAAIAAMCGGWMMGRGMTGSNPFLPIVLKKIDDNVADQVRQNSAVFQQLKEQKGDVKAAMAALKQQQIGYAEQRAKGMGMRSDSDAVKAGIQSLTDQLAAKREQHRNDEEKALQRTVTEKFNRRMVANPAIAAEAAKKPTTFESQRAQMINDARATLSTLKGGMASGKLAEGVGPIDSTLHSLARSLGMADPKVTEQIIALEDNVLNHVMKLSREPANKIQERFADILKPKSDAELPAFVQKLERELAMAIAQAGEEGGPVGQPVANPTKVY